MEKQAKELEGLEESLTRKKTAMDDIRNSAQGLNIKLTETTMRRQNQIDRVTSEYSMTESQLMEEVEPSWEGEKPSIESMETIIAELHTKIESMGPVNLVAIEEYQELEERYNFLTQQEQDLINSKQQLMDMIKKINITTSEMFSSTFAAVNENFQNMFKKLFNGGLAKLILVNEEDVLECGIEIIARPPGKRLQNISLLSGGERTLTAVALLFAIYMIKPSPFCLLDELDAPLDESNIGRFVNVLQDFLKQSQFVVITHNRQTISAASVLYGVTMPEKGISKMVSMKFNEQKKRTFDTVAPIPVAPVPSS
jgi:chromosome segregation protein